MRYSLLAFFSLFLLITTSCRKNDRVLNPPPGSLLDSITYTAVSNPSITNGLKFKYDGAGRLVQHIADNERIIQFSYDAQNRITNVSAYSRTYPGSSFGDTLVYSANGRIVRSYRRAMGTTSYRPSRTYVFDSSNRLIFDSIYTARIPGFVDIYAKYSYNAGNDLQGVVFYTLAANNFPSYTPGDSLAYTYDTNESPFYKHSFAFYNVFFNVFNRSLPTDLIVYDPNMGLCFSKHNVVSSSSFRSSSSQPSTVNSYTSNYYSSGLLRTQVMSYSFNASYDVRGEFLYW